ncbi:MAG: CopG family transcriptional regulator [Candidatus Bathyarchaeia archaeon]
MSKYVTVSVKIPREIKDKLEKLGIKPSLLLKEAILKEIRRREMEDLRRRINEVKPILKRISIEYAVKSIREDRERR